MKYVHWKIAILIAVILSLFGCGYNQVIDDNEAANSAWGEVENQYQRRADLVPNLVRVVQGAANFEKSTLTAVTEARASVGRMKISPDDLSDPSKFKQFQEAQDKLGGALQRLLVVSENYPQLRATDSFRDLQVQLEGTENRITVARGRYTKAVERLNRTVQNFPTSIGAGMRGIRTRPQFQAKAGSDVAPEVKFQ